MAVPAPLEATPKCSIRGSFGRRAVDVRGVRGEGLNSLAYDKTFGDNLARSHDISKLGTGKTVIENFEFRAGSGLSEGNAVFLKKSELQLVVCTIIDQDSTGLAGSIYVYR